MANENFYGEHQTVQITTGNPATVNDSVARAPLGTRIRWKGNTWRYVLFDNGTGNVASAAAKAAYWKTLTPATDPPVYTVTSDYTDTLFGKGGVAGIFGGVVTDAYYCWIQTAGVASVTVAGAIEGDNLVADTTDGVFAKIASGSNITEKVYGTVAGGTTGSTPTALLQNLDW